MWTVSTKRTCLRLVAHHQRVGAGAAAEEADAVEQVAFGDAGRREDEVLARRQVGRWCKRAPRRVDAHPLGALALLVAAEAEAAPGSRRPGSAARPR